MSGMPHHEFRATQSRPHCCTEHEAILPTLFVNFCGSVAVCCSSLRLVCLAACRCCQCLVQSVCLRRRRHIRVHHADTTRHDTTTTTPVVSGECFVARAAAETCRTPATMQKRNLYVPNKFARHVVPATNFAATLRRTRCSTYSTSRIIICIVTRCC